MGNVSVLGGYVLGDMRRPVHNVSPNSFGDMVGRGLLPLTVSVGGGAPTLTSKT